MADTTAPPVRVHGSIKLGQFLKLAGLVEDGGQARIAVQYGDVRVNGRVETRRGHRLRDGDTVTVDLPGGPAGARVAVVPEDDGEHGPRAPTHR